MTNSPSNPPQLAVVLSFERLPLKLLSCYGSELGQTPVLDRLASRGILGDLHFAEDLSDERTRHAWWDGGDLSASDAEENGSSLAAVAARNGIRCRLISDCQPASWDIAPSGWETTYLEQADDEELTATSAFERLMAEVKSALDELSESHQAAVLWVHSSELSRVPIPSMEFLDLFLDELPGMLVAAGDEPETTTDLPESDAADSSDEHRPEELTDFQRSAAFELIEETLSLLSDDSSELQPVHIKTLNVLAAARLAECDRSIGRIFELVEPQVRSGEALFLLTADRGLALGEGTLTKRLEAEHLHGPLQEEVMHVPLLLVNGRRELGRRLRALTSPADLPATILDWFGIEFQFPLGRSLLPLSLGEADTIHEHLVCRAGDWEAIREIDWLLIRNRPEGVEKLYIKPEDRWQVLDVLSQYIDEADRLIALLNES